MTILLRTALVVCLRNSAAAAADDDDDDDDDGLAQFPEMSTYLISCGMNCTRASANAE